MDKAWPAPTLSAIGSQLGAGAKLFHTGSRDTADGTGASRLRPSSHGPPPPTTRPLQIRRISWHQQCIELGGQRLRPP